MIISGEEEKELKESLAKDDITIDSALRPSSFDEYVGQEVVKRNVKVIVEAARQRGESDRKSVV